MFCYILNLSTTRALITVWSSHRCEHFTPQFMYAISRHPRCIDLPFQDWEEALRPVLMLRDEMFKLSTLSTSNSPWKRGFCDGCSVFYAIDNLLLHLSFFRGNAHATAQLSQYQHPLWYSRSIGDPETELIDGGNFPFTPRSTLLKHQ